MFIPHTITPDNFPASARTLADWRAGRRTPGAAARVLLDLLASGRVMPNTSAWSGWRFVGAFLESASGQHIAPGELDNVRLLRSLLDHSHRRERKLQAEIARLETLLHQLEGNAGAANAPRWG